MGFLDSKLPADIARQRMEEKKRQKEKHLRMMKWGALIGSALLVASIALFITVGRPALAYYAAQLAMESGQYDDASSRFAALGDYKDAVQLEQESRRLKGLDYLERGRYEQAYRVFVALGSYEDASELALESRYQKALNFKEIGEPIAAIAELKEISTYKDAGALIDALKAESAEAFQTAGEIWAAWGKLQAGDTVRLGAYDQDNNAADGEEPIEWLVLESDGESALLISRYALECKVYNNNTHRTTWEECALREWLNDVFYLEAFSDAEKALIQTVTVISEENPQSKYNPPAGNDARDRVYILSVSEARRYFERDADRVAYITPTAIEHGAYNSTGNEAWWWLRGPGNFGAYAPFVDKTGAIDVFGNSATNTGESVRPVIRVGLSGA